MEQFVFYSKSADEPPGMGRHEIGNPDDFPELAKIKDWRKMLSNMYISQFTLGGKIYNSVEHLFHAGKFWRDDPEFAKKFTLDHESPWNKDPFLAKTAGKTGRVSDRTGKVFKSTKLNLPTNIKMRSDFYEGVDKNIMTLGLYAKFSQNQDLRNLLISTKNAKLFHLVTERGKKSKLQHWDHLERVRECIQKYPPIIL